MTPEIMEHLNKVEGVVEQTKRLLARHGYPGRLANRPGHWFHNSDDRAP